MGQGFSEEGKKIRAPAIKGLIFFAFLALAFYSARFSPAKDFFTPQVLDPFLRKAGLWAPLAFILIYAAGVCLLLPGTFFSFLGVALFGGYDGFLYVYLGAMAGATAAFWIGRTMGRDFAASLIGKRLKKYDDAIARNGFATVLYLRLIHFPFSALNFGMGLTRVSFRDYFWGTGWGILVGVFIFTFFLGTLREIWAGGQWHLLLSLRVYFSVGLFVFSFFIPKIIRKLRKGKEFWDSDILE
ncbi:MAG: TVP38/TMEM64 family protein [Syntrophaceae bacterium]|nr:TVP38/TMEM64 family protein [Syntrophaceae bacterium]